MARRPKLRSPLKEQGKFFFSLHILSAKFKKKFRLKDAKGALTHAVLQYAVGVAPSLPWGSGASPLGRAVSSATQGEAGASALNVSYSDSGLFGVVISSSGDAAGKVLYS